MKKSIKIFGKKVPVWGLLLGVGILLFYLLKNSPATMNAVNDWFDKSDDTKPTEKEKQKALIKAYLLTLTKSHNTDIDLLKETVKKFPNVSKDIIQEVVNNFKGIPDTFQNPREQVIHETYVKEHPTKPVKPLATKPLTPSLDEGEVLTDYAPGGSSSPGGGGFKPNTMDIIEHEFVLNPKGSDIARLQMEAELNAMNDPYDNGR